MIRPLNLALVSQQITRNDGQGRVNYEIAQGALDAGWDVTLIGVHVAPDLSSHSRVKLVKFNFESWPTQLLRNMAFSRASSRWINANRGLIDVLHVNGCTTSADADVNAAHFVHGAWARNPFYPFRRWWRNPYNAYQRLFTLLNAHSELPAFERAKAVVAVSSKVASELESVGVPRHKISIICNGVDTDEFRPGPSERERFGLPPRVPLFLFVGDIRTPRKNLGTVLSALAQVPTLHLAVAGLTAGSPFPELARKLGVSDRVYFLNTVRDMPALMRSVDAFVFPSRYETMGLVVLEAIASGLPVITAHTVGAAEFLGASARILDNPDDIASLASWMRELMEGTDLRQSMGAQGRLIALDYNWQNMTKQYRALYTRIRSERVGEVRDPVLAC